MALIGFCLPVRAEVLEILPDGQVTVHAGPALYLSADMRPQPIKAARRRAHTAPTPSASIRDAIRSASARYGVSADLVSAVAWQESRFDNGAVSPKGARGVMQLMPDTARALNVDAASPEANVTGGTAYLAALFRRYDGDLVKTLAAYNAGPDAVDRFAGPPPYRETHDYIDAVFERMATIALSPSASQETFP